MTNDQRKLIELLKEYEAAANRGDAARVSRLYTDDAILLPESFPTSAGLEAIHGFYAGAFSMLELAIEFDIDPNAIVVQGNQAFATTSSTGTRRIKASGDVVPEDNRELWIFSRAEGEWKIARYMFNKVNAAA